MAEGFGQALALTLLVWLCFVYGSYVVSELIGGRTNFLEKLPLDLPAVVLIALVAQLLYPVAVVTRRWPAAARWPLILLGAMVAAAVQALINVGENRLLGVIPQLDGAHADAIRQRFGRMFLSHTYLTFANAALFVFLVEARRLADERLRRARSDALAAQAHEAALRLQLNPHFLFNTLNSISSLVVTARPADAEEMLGRLADFLRLSLAGDPAGLVPLEEEFAAIESYLAIEAVRFGDRMQLEFALPAELAATPVPHLIAQPLAENAVKHGVAARVGAATVRIRAWSERGQLMLGIEDEGTGPASGSGPGLGVGTANVRQRLERHYGNEAELRLLPTALGFRSSISLPLPA